MLGASATRGGCVAAAVERKTDAARGKVVEHDVLDGFAAGRSLRLSISKLQHAIGRSSVRRASSSALRLRMSSDVTKSSAAKMLSLHV